MPVILDNSFNLDLTADTLRISPICPEHFSIDVCEQMLDILISVYLPWCKCSLDRNHGVLVILAQKGRVTFMDCLNTCHQMTAHF